MGSKRLISSTPCNITNLIFVFTVKPEFEGWQKKLDVAPEAKTLDTVKWKLDKEMLLRSCHTTYVSVIANKNLEKVISIILGKTLEEMPKTRLT